MRLLFLTCILFIFILPLSTAITPPAVTLSYPTDFMITNVSSDMTLSCGVSDDENVYSVSLYHDMGGNFSLNETNRTMGLQYDSGSLIFCEFDGSYDCIDGETGTSSGTAFQDSWMGQGVLVTGEDTLYYPLSGNMYYDQGTIEMWLMVGFDPNDDAFILSTGTGDANRIKIYTTYGDTRLVLGFYDDYNRETNATVDITSWAMGEWHHIAAVWDVNNLVGSGRVVDMFIDGSNLSASYDGDYYSKGSSLGSSIYLGSNAAGSMQSNSVIDEFAVSSGVLSAADINSTYQRLIADHTSGTFNWTFYNLSDGTYIWNCLAYDNETQSSWASANYTFSIDALTPPTVIQANTTPSSAEELDPGVTVNVTLNVTDVSNVSSVILMYKSPYAGIYTNDTMDYNTGTGLWENGSIVTNNDEGNWSYKVWSNDSWGHAGTTSVYTLAVEKERSWSIEARNVSGEASQTLGPVTGFGGTVQNLGTVTINNTGDYVANFDLYAYYMEGSVGTADISYNVSEPFDLQSGESVCIEVNATLPVTANEYVAGINITTTSLPEIRSLNATMVSSISGPYINETTEIRSYPLSVAQSSSGNFTARIKNIGNETAENVTLNWSFPSGWSLTYGNQSHFVGNLTPYEEVTLTVTAYAGPSATAGGAVFWINASDASGSTSGSDLKLTSVSCTSGDGECGSGCSYPTDTDCEAPSTGTGRTKVVGVGTVSVGEPGMEVELPGRVDLNRGTPYSFRVNVTNTLKGSELRNVTLSLSGYEASMLSVSPPLIGYIPYGSLGVFTVTVAVPAYMEEKDYIVSANIGAVGLFGSTLKELSRPGKMVFSVHGVMGNESLMAIAAAESAISEMSAKGLNVAKLSGLLDDARRAYDALDFDSAESTAKGIVLLRDKALSILAEMDRLYMDIADAERYGMSVGEAKRMAELAKSAFQRGDYDRAESRITAAVNAYRLETKDLIGVMRFLYYYWPYMLVMFVCAAMAFFVARGRMVERSVRLQIEKTKKSKGAVKELLMRLQEDYYGRRSMSKMEYVEAKQGYQRRLAKLGSEELALRRKLAALKGKKGGLAAAKEDAERAVRQLQKDYFENGKMGKVEYEESLQELQGEIAEMERGMESVKRRGRGKKGMAVLFVAFAILAAAGGLSQAAGNVTAGDASAAITAAADVIREMSGMGYGIGRLNSTLENARLLFSRGEYDVAVTNARYVTVLKDKALLVDGMIDEVELRLQEMSSAGHDVSAPQSLFAEAASEFDSENYEDAESHLTAAMDSLDRIGEEASIERAAEGGLLQRAASFVDENATAIIAAAALVVLLCVLALSRARKSAKRKKVNELKRDIEGTKELMKRLQDDYFNRQSMGKKGYESGMDRLRKNLASSMERLEAETRNAA